MVGYIYSEIRNIVTGLDKLNELDASYGSLGKRVQKTSQSNDKYARATRKLNFINMAALGIESHLTSSALKRIIQSQREQKAAKEHGISVADLTTGLKRTGTVLDKHGDLWKDTGDEITDQATAWSELIQSTKRFRMELAQLSKEQKAAKGMGISVSDLNVGLKRSGMVLGDDGKLWKDTGEQIKDQDAAQRELIASTKRFRMELLSLMFFGQMVGRMFERFAKSADEAVGVTKLWGVFWTLVGLPAALTMVKVVTSLINLWSRLPGPLQTVISWIGRIVYWAGALVGVWFAIELGWAGLLKHAPKLAANLIWIWKNWILVGAKAAWAGTMMAGAWLKGLGPLGWIIMGVILLTTLLTILYKKSEKFRNLWNNWGPGNLVNAKLGFGVRPMFGAPVQAASGGIFTRPTPAIIGEAGPEAVIPLSGGMGLGNVTYNPTINVYASVNNDMDLRSLANKLNQYLFADMRRVTVR